MSQITNRIKLRRLSSMPNKFGQIMYAVEEPAENLTGIDGILEGKNGRMLFSPVRVGKHDTVFLADCRLTTATTGKVYVNLIDKSSDEIGNLGYASKQFERAGLGGNGAFAIEAAKHVIAMMTGQIPTVQTTVTGARNASTPVSPTTGENESELDRIAREEVAEVA